MGINHFNNFVSFFFIGIIDYEGFGHSIEANGEWRMANGECVGIIILILNDWHISNDICQIDTNICKLNKVGWHVIYNKLKVLGVSLRQIYFTIQNTIFSDGNPRYQWL